LLRRAQLVAQLQHPNLTRLLPLPGGAGLTPVLKGLRRLSEFGSDEAPFGRLGLDHALQLLLDVLNGLSAVHQLSFEGKPFVHGAISPAQICIDGHGSARLIPLLSSHVMPDPMPESNGYAAPELLLGSSVDQRADLFTLGVLLWEALAGKRLFPDASPAAVLARCTSDSLPGLSPPPHTEWARPLCAVAARALAIDAADRFDNAQAFSDAIIAAAGPRLTCKLGEAWQDEAPTLVPRRNSYVPPSPLPPRRSFTPPGVTIELLPQAELSSEPTLALPRPPLVPLGEAAEPQWLPEAGTSPASPRPLFAAPRARQIVLGLGGLTLLLLAWAARPTRQATPIAAGVTPLATLSAVTSTLAPPYASAPAPSLASARLVASAAQPRSAPPTPRPVTLLKSSTPSTLRSSKPARRPADFDYGI
jgi:serine/threonine-protein kinase